MTKTTWSVDTLWTASPTNTMLLLEPELGLGQAVHFQMDFEPLAGYAFDVVVSATIDSADPGNVEVVAQITNLTAIIDDLIGMVTMDLTYNASSITHQYPTANNFWQVGQTMTLTYKGAIA